MKILAIGAHPDDETLGAGGTLLNHHKQGDQVYWYLATKLPADRYTPENLQVQENYVELIQKKLHIQQLFWPGFATANLDIVPLEKIILSLAETLESIQPDIVYLAGDTDIHSDHTVLYKAFLSAAKPYYTSRRPKKILTWETISSTDAYPNEGRKAFIPNVFSDISITLVEKLNIMEKLDEQLQDTFFPRSLNSIQALARYRGSMIGVQYAEAFRSIFEII